MALSTLLRVLAIALAVAASVMVARLGGPGAKGVAAAFAATATTAYAVASMGVPEQVVQVITATGLAPRRLLLWAWSGYLVVTVTIVAFLVPASASAALVAAGCLLYLVPMQAGIVALGASGVLSQSLGAVLQPAAMAFLAGVFAIDGSLGHAEAVLATALSYVPPLVIYWRAIPGSRNLITPGDVLQLFVHGSKWQVPNLALRIVQRSDVLVVFVLLGAASAGRYSVATQLSELAFLVPRQVAGHVYYRASMGREVSLRRAVAVATFGALITAVVVAGVAWYTITLLYGAPFESSRVLLLVLLPGPVLGTAALVLSMHFRARAMFWPSAIAGPLGAMTVLGLAVLLVPRFGAMGAAIASTTGWATFTVAALLLCRRHGIAPTVDLVPGTHTMPEAEQAP